MLPDDNPVNDQRISLFLRKLWTLVCSKETDNVITWSEVYFDLFLKIIFRHLLQNLLFCPSKCV